jgi:5-methylcytosine-specific restriction endonuclease McrA
VLLDKETLIHLYIEQKLSTKQIAEQFQVGYMKVYHLLIKYGIPIRTKKEACLIWHENNITSNKGKKKPWLSSAMSGENHFFYGKKRPDMSERFSGEGNPMFGKPVSEDTRNIISNSSTGRIVSEYTKKLISEANIGKPKSDDTKKKLSDAALIRFKNPENHPRWNGGVSTINNLIRTSDEYNKWRVNVFIRDGFKCVICDSIEKLCVDHIIPFAVIIVTNNIKTMEDSLSCSELWSLDNGRVLCHECHKETDTYGNKTRELLKNLKPN